MSIALVCTAWTARADSTATWQQLQPFPDYGTCTVFDTAHNRWLFFGHEDGANDTTGVWILDRSIGAWSALPTTGTPPPIASCGTAVYDSRHGRVFVASRYGGYLYPFPTGIWMLDLVGIPRWSKYSGQSLNWGTALVYDSRRDRLLSFGGEFGTFTSFSNTVAAMDLATGAKSWSTIATGETAPTGRSYAAVVYDSLTDRLVTFGGRGYAPHNPLSSVPYDESWELSLNADPPTWTFLAPVAPIPMARWRHAGVLGGHQLVVYGGEGDGRNVYFDDLWSLSLDDSVNARWTFLSPSIGPRVSTLAAFDPLDGVMLMQGGSDGVRTVNGAWSLRVYGTPSFTALTPGSRIPPARESHAGLYDPVRHRTIVVGGNADGEPAGTWSFVPGLGWQQLTGTSPADHGQGVCIYDPVRDRIVLYLDTGTWGLDLATPSQWYSFATQGTPPAHRTGSSAIYDPVGRRMVLFGGNVGPYLDSDETWTLSLDATPPAWSLLDVPGVKPAARMDQVAIYDPVRRRMLIAGGSDTTRERNDTWALSFDSTSTWTPLGKPGNVPTGFDDAVYNPVTDAMIVVGGNVPGPNNTRLQTAYTLPLATPPSWARLATRGRPPLSHERGTAVWDVLRHEVIMFSGHDDNNHRLDDTWALAFADTGAVDSLTDTLTFVPPSITSIDTTSDHVELSWDVSGIHGDVSVERRSEPGDWIEVARLSHATEPSVAWDDSLVTPDAVYDYRLAFIDGGAIHYSATVRVHVPAPPVVPPPPPPPTLGFAVPNPTHGALSFDYTLATSAAARIEVFDIGGRRVAEQRVAAGSAGPHHAGFDASGGWRSGVYVVRLTQDGRAVAHTAALIR